MVTKGNPPKQRWLPILLLAVAAWLPIVAAGSEDLERGRAIWNFHCYFCHGYAGDAATLAASFLDPPPRNFRATSVADLPRKVMVDAVSHGRDGTAMQAYRDRLDAADIEFVVDFVIAEFMVGDRDNTRYHTPENGWPDHRRYTIAFPFATGEIPLDTPWDQLSDTQADGKRLFLASCVSCHDRARVEQPGVEWESRPLSYPRAGYSHRPGADIDATSGASPYALHDEPPPLPEGADALLRQGAQLFLDNCAFCHAADGTGRNWIGRFMEPHPRDLTSPEFMRTLTAERLRHVIRDGLPGTSMPAWKGVLDTQQVEALVRYIDGVMHPLAREAP